MDVRRNKITDATTPTPNPTPLQGMKHELHVEVQVKSLSANARFNQEISHYFARDPRVSMDFSATSGLRTTTIILFHSLVRDRDGSLKMPTF